MDLLPAQSAEALYRRVYRSLRAAILSGEWPAGRRLPSSRELAREWGVARNTVIEAVELLMVEGYLVARPASGTFVAPSLAPEHPRGALSQTEDQHPPLHLSGWAERALAAEPAREAELHFEFDFRPGQVPTDIFPSEAWAQALSARSRDLQRGGYGDELGPLETREALVAYLRRERGVQATPDMLMLTSGSQGSLDALARVFLEPGRHVAVEDPGYLGARRVFEAAGAHIHAVPVDEDGLMPEALPSEATLLYVTPAHQFPTGAILPAERRMRILEWARRTGAWVIEDDYNSEFRFGSRPLTALQGLSPHGVIYVGTFSKSLAPALRSGYLVAPARLVRTLARARALTDRQPPTLDALALAEFLQGGQYARHVRYARGLAEERAEALRAALERHLPSWRPRFSGAGLHLYVELPPELDEKEVRRRAGEAGVGVGIASEYALTPQPSAVLLAFAHLSPLRIGPGIERLARATR
ncbi:PLP-dependent aminotransferase family protein [Deinococcus peraridilitoris]|uniref:Transcriptional regulator with HTH domain and aminotransferase domain protein n=1 Tax=Deinococcus peraridilitoris (strain DSM 19664 / LMG 22246 / CIP 109416 / KR-200) TaxID=937777 RepID=L0A562_DEIPD|nr:PLP-dependent aminotransferase family protein [Deinococcus peraridilitoris]AFZ69006.1 transcriptional regulator with HTH domain and aminotransferase domain protein [Deinococcus peraridilitoris DSM 19664]